MCLGRPSPIPTCTVWLIVGLAFMAVVRADGPERENSKAVEAVSSFIAATASPSPITTTPSHSHATSPTLTSTGTGTAVSSLAAPVSLTPNATGMIIGFADAGGVILGLVAWSVIGCGCAPTTLPFRKKAYGEDSASRMLPRPVTSSASDSVPPAPSSTPAASASGAQGRVGKERIPSVLMKL
ncbi:hypothetical protein IAT38_003721 [Cryptococcus sp. DSM 104549]